MNGYISTDPYAGLPAASPVPVAPALPSTGVQGRSVVPLRPRRRSGGGGMVAKPMGSPQQIKTAYKAGAITRGQAIKHLRLHGFK